MDGVFSAQTWRGVPCRGRRPWLAVPNERCSCESRALQRGASNLYFPVIDSALSIPPWSDALQHAIGIYWNTIVNVQNEDRAKFIIMMAQGDLAPILREVGLSPEELAQHVDDRLKRYNDESILNIRQEEYRQFVLGTDTTSDDTGDFEVRNVSVPENLAPYVSRVVRVVRLREVRALKGFTRINPPGDEDSPDIASISVASPDWLPAVEVRGEGIFLEFNREAFETGKCRSV